MKQTQPMNHFVKTQSIATLFLLCTFPMFALNLQVNPKVGSSTSFSISQVQNLTFSGGNLVVNKKDATTSSYNRSNVAYINFTSGFMTAMTAPQITSKLTLYPSPAHDVMNIEFADAAIQTVNIEIIGIDGKVLLRTVLNNAKSSISVSSLPKGIYFCRTNNGIITKFIKQ